MTVAQLIIDANAVKNTSSGLVEWDSNSLQLVVDDMEALHLQRGCYQVADVATMETVGNDETLFVGIEGVGIFFWSATGPYNGTTVFNSADGGFWRKQLIAASGATTLAALTDVNLTGPTNGQALTYDTATSKWINASIVVSWSNLSNKPRVIQEMTFGSVLSTYNIGFNDCLPSATSGAYANIVISDSGLPNFTDGAFNTVLAPQGITDMLEGNSSVVITPAPALHAASSGTQAVERCVVIGDCGDLDDFYASNSLTAVMALGTDQRPWIVTAASEMYFDYDNSMLSSGKKFNFNGTAWFNDEVRIDGAVDINAVVDISGQCDVDGVFYPNGGIFTPAFTDFTSGEVGTGWLRLSDSSSALPRWRLDAMGRVTLAGGMFASSATPDAICLTFADSSIHPQNIQTFICPVTNTAATNWLTFVSVTVNTDGTLRVYYDAGTVTSKVIWLSGISYFID